MPTDVEKSLLDHSENALVEQPSIELFGSLGWQTANCFDELRTGGARWDAGRRAKWCWSIGCGRPCSGSTRACRPRRSNWRSRELIRDRSVMALAAANREVYDMLKNGVRRHFPRRPGWRRGDRRSGQGHRLAHAGEQRFLPGFAVLGLRRDAHAAAGPDRLRQRSAAGVRGTETAGTRGQGCLRRQPERLQGHDPAVALVQRAGHSVQRQGGQDRQHHGRVGAFRRLEANQQRGRTGRGLAGDDDPRARASRRGCWIWSRISPCSWRCAAG